MRQPVRRHLKKAILGVCAPNARLDMLTLHGAETVDADRLQGFKRAIDTAIDRIVRS